MGITASFVLLSKEQYDLILRDRNALVEPNPRVVFDVDKSWNYFDEVFREFGPPLSLVFVGDYLPDGLWAGDSHLGYISPELVRAIGTSLTGIEPEHIFARAAAIGHDLVLKPERELMYRDFFFELKIGFRVALRCGGALQVGIS